MFDIGDTVKCVNAVRPSGENPTVVPNWVKDGDEYTIRGFHNNDEIVVGVLLEEIENPIIPMPLVNRFQEPAFATWRFEKTADAPLEEDEEEDENYVPEELQELLEELSID